MGTLIFFIPVYFLFVLIQKILQRCQGSSQRVDKANRYLKQSLYYKALITGVLESYQMLTLSVMIGLYSLNWDSIGTSAQSAACLFFAVFLIVAPAKLIWTTARNFDSLGEKKMQTRYGSFYEGLRLAASSKTVLLQPTFFLLRRNIMAFAIVVCRKTLIVQIYLIWAQSTIAAFIIGFTSPYTARSQERVEYFNEVI